MTDDTEPGVRITNRDIYDKLVAVERKVDPLPKQVEDHETRLRAIETAINRNAWLPVLVTAVLTALIVATAVRFLIP